MSKYQSVRGTRDLLPEVKKVFRHIENIAFNNAKNYGFNEIETPLFEFSEVFHRSLGETSDAVSKETYDFVDRGGDKLTLRPEGTAGVIRAYISEGLAQKNPNKLYYFGPMFRYERPQRGRFRQFYQVGIEMIGLESPLADVECLDLAYQFLKQIGLSQSTVLHINTLGDQQSRERYRSALLEYLRPYKDQLSEDSQKRLEKNPLRILDSKSETDKAIVANAPLLEQYLNDESRDFFKTVCQGLDLLKIPYMIDSKLVRGLDYYCHTVFEFVTQELGSQGAVLAGGRYDGLVELLGGAKTPGVGWGSGVDRLVDLFITTSQKMPEAKQPISIAVHGEKALLEGLQISQKLREKNIYCELLLQGNFKKKLEKANKLNSSHALLIFEQDNGQFEYKIKNFSTGEEKLVSKEDCLNSF